MTHYLPDISYTRIGCAFIVQEQYEINLGFSSFRSLKRVSINSRDMQRVLNVARL